MTEEVPAPGGSPDQQAAGGTGRPFGLRSDILVGGVILVFTAIVFAITTTFDEVPRALSQGLDPEGFPRLILGVIVVLVAAMMVRAQRQPDSPRKPVPRIALLTAAALVVFVGVVDWLGAAATMVLFCAGLPVLWGERRWGWIAAYAVLFPSSVYLLFSTVLEVRFPLGLFGG